MHRWKRLCATIRRLRRRRGERLELDHCHYLYSTRAELLRRLGRTDEARGAYSRALELVHSDAERRFLERRQTELSGCSICGDPTHVFAFASRCADN